MKTKLLFAIFLTIGLSAFAQNPKIKPNTSPPSGTKPANTTPSQPSTNPTNTNNNTPTNTNTANTTATTNSRKESEEAVMVNVNLAVAVAEGEFKTTSNDNWGFGVSGYFAFNPFHDKLDNNLIRPFLLGVQLEYIWFDSKSDDYNTEDAFSTTAVESKVAVGAFAIGAAGRCEFLSKVVYPFVEYQAGLRFFNGSHDVSYERTAKSGVSGAQQNRKEEFSKNLESSIVGYYGWGAGIGFNAGGFRMEGKVVYQYGGRARYIDPESIVFNQIDNSVTYATKTSATDLFIPQFGISFTF